MSVGGTVGMRISARAKARGSSGSIARAEARGSFGSIARAKARGSLRFEIASRKVAMLLAVVLFFSAAEAWAQSSSIYLGAIEKTRQAAEQAKGKNQSASTGASDVDRTKPLNPELEKVSLFAVQTRPPNEFRVHDLISVIVRELKAYESDSLLRTKRDFTIETKIDGFLRTLNGHLAAASFTDGKPSIDFSLETQLNSRGDAERNDKLTFRLTAEIIDIKPNGLLVLSGKEKIIVDEEVQFMRFTGTCRSRDVTADNTILSTQVFDQVIDIQHKGAVRDVAKRGWLLRLFEWLNPI